MVKVLQASVSYPGVFKTVDFEDSIWFTGSAIYEIDILAPIIHCEEMGYLPEDIVIDVVLSGNPHMPHVYANIYNAFAVAQRTFEIMDYYERMYGLLRAKRGHPDVTYRYVIGPLRQMPNKIIPVTYSEDEVKMQIDFGEKDAKIFIEHEKDAHKNDKPVVQATQNSDVRTHNFDCSLGKQKRYANEDRQLKYELACGL